MSKLLEHGNAVWNALRLVKDNWQNVFTGLGTARDKTEYGSFVGLREIPETELTAMYHQDDTVRRFVALKPQEMMRRGFTISIDGDTELSTEVLKNLRALKAGVKIRDAMIWGRLYGGCAILIGADDGLPADMPLNKENIRAVKFLHIIDKRYLQPEMYFNDPLEDENYGEPSHFMVTPRRGGKMTIVHRSRLIIFGGAHTSDEERDRLGGWDHSVVTAAYPVLRSFNSVWKSAEHLMADASQGVFKIQGLMSMIAGGQKEELQTRMQLVDMSRSVARSLLLDADGGEDFTRLPSSFTDAQNMLDKFMMRFSAMAEVPVTIFMGRSPAGMNATGDADFRWFYDTIATAQENELKPELEQLCEIVMLAKEGPTGGQIPEKWELKFAPLWQPTESEQADLESKKAASDKIYIDAGVLLPEEVALSRFRTEGWCSATQIDREVRESVLEAEVKMMEEQKDQPLPAPPVPGQPPQDGQQPPPGQEPASEPEPEEE